MTLSLLEAVGVSLVTHRGTTAERSILTGIDVSARAGAVTVFGGPTGSGKSSLVHLFGGLRRPTEGEIRADGEPVSRYTAAHRDRWRRDVGILFQGAELVGDLTAAENVMLPLIPRDGAISDKASAVTRMMQMMDLADVADQPARECSGGERQRTALARAMITEPALLLLDEPSAHQDDSWTAAILDLVIESRTRGAVVVIATHDPRILRGSVPDALHFLDRGRLQIGSRPTGTSSP